MCVRPQVMNLRNPYNEDKPIKISRDGQEVEPSVGRQLCVKIDEGYVANPAQSMKRKRLEDLDKGFGPRATHQYSMREVVCVP